MNKNKNHKKTQRGISHLIKEIKNLIQLAKPQLLLGQTYNCLYFSMQNTTCETEMSHESKIIICLLEYAHAVYASTLPNPKARQLTAQEHEQLLQLMNDFYQESWGIIHSTDNVQKEYEFAGKEAANIKFWAQANWLSIRCNRYVQHNLPFFRHMLEPHSEAIYKAYNIEFEIFLEGIKQIQQTLFLGTGKLWEKTLQTYKDRRYESDNLLVNIGNAYYLNISKITGWPQLLLDDLSYNRGENDCFFDDENTSGWLLKTLPCRWKPFLYIDNYAYAFEPTFAIESIYRALQRGLLYKLPDYKEQWNYKQKLIAETIFSKIFSRQLIKAKVYQSVEYKFKGKWRECDCVIMIDDVMLIIESKAGAYSLAGVDSSIDEHIKRLQGLLLDSYNQAKFFLEYLDSEKKQPIFQSVKKERKKIGDVELNAYRIIIPIGLTIEHLAPFTTMLKRLPKTGAILEKYPFIALSINDLYPITELLPTAGELIHYLEVRQIAASHPNLFLHDEIDHLGAYIQQNRFDTIVSDPSLEKTNEIVVNGMSDVIDKYYYESMTNFFAEKQVYKIVPPVQEYPKELHEILDWLEANGTKNWLALNSIIRNLSGKQRSEVANRLQNGLKSYKENVFYLFGDCLSITFVQDFIENRVSEDYIYFIGASSASAFNSNLQPVICLSYSFNKNIEKIRLNSCRPPSVVQKNYPKIMAKSQQIKKLLEEAINV